MDTIFMNWENTKTCKPYVLMLNLPDKIDIWRGEKRIALSNHCIFYTLKNIKRSYETTINFKLQLQHGMMNLNSLMDHVLY